MIRQGRKKRKTEVRNKIFGWGKAPLSAHYFKLNYAANRID